MTNIFRRAGVDIPEPFRRFLEGDLDAWLRVEEYRESGSLVVKAEARASILTMTSTSPWPAASCRSPSAVKKNRNTRKRKGTARNSVSAPFREP